MDEKTMVNDILACVKSDLTAYHEKTIVNFFNCCHYNSPTYVSELLFL